MSVLSSIPIGLSYLSPTNYQAAGLSASISTALRRPAVVRSMMNADLPGGLDPNCADWQSSFAILAASQAALSHGRAADKPAFSFGVDGETNGNREGSKSSANEVKTIHGSGGASLLPPCPRQLSHGHDALDHQPAASISAVAVAD